MISSQDLIKKKNSSNFHTIKKIKAKLFSIKKMKRNGLFEKKQLKLRTVLRKGRWTKEEHTRFIKACLLYGSKWRKIHEAVKTRTSAQVRSHAQKYIIKLCKKYNIEIKSKRKSCFLSNHLNFPYKRKNKKNILPLEKISRDDKKILKSFNFYIKLVDIDKVEENEEKIFNINKAKKINSEMYFYSYPTTKQDENFEDQSENSYHSNLLNNKTTNNSCNENNFILSNKKVFDNLNYIHLDNYYPKFKDDPTQIKMDGNLPDFNINLLLNNDISSSLNALNFEFELLGKIKSNNQFTLNYLKNLETQDKQIILFLNNIKNSLKEIYEINSLNNKPNSNFELEKLNFVFDSLTSNILFIDNLQLNQFDV